MSLNQPGQTVPLTNSWRAKVIQFTKYCLVGGTGVVVDMGVLYLVRDSGFVVLPIWLAKLCAGEAALLSNFCLNEMWTFRIESQRDGARESVLRRLFGFHLICGVGIILALVILHVVHISIGLNLYVSNGVAILIVTVWNFTLNQKLNWKASRAG